MGGNSCKVACPVTETPPLPGLLIDQLEMSFPWPDHLGQPQPNDLESLSQKPVSGAPLWEAELKQRGQLPGILMHKPLRVV